MRTQSKEKQGEESSRISNQIKSKSRDGIKPTLRPRRPTAQLGVVRQRVPTASPRYPKDIKSEMSKSFVGASKHTATIKGKFVIQGYMRQRTGNRRGKLSLTIDHSISGRDEEDKSKSRGDQFFSEPKPSTTLLTVSMFSSCVFLSGTAGKS